LKRKTLIYSLLQLVCLSCGLQQTDKEFKDWIRNQDFKIVSRQNLDEGHRLFKLEATDLKTGEDILFEDILIYYANFTAICKSTPFIAVGDTLIKKRGEIIYRLNKKNCQCILVLKDSVNTKNNDDIDWFNSRGCN
jgi:hypothetical protein